MRHLIILAALGLVACGGAEEPAPQPKPTLEPKPAPAPAPVPAPADTVSKDADISGLSEEEQQAFLMKLGETVYKTGDGGLACTTCHQENGMGTPGAFPPLVGEGAREHMGDCAQHAGLVIDGLSGEITVDGVTYNGVMVPQGDQLNDLQIAAVISYERNSWGNDFGWCMPEDVAKARAE